VIDQTTACLDAYTRLAEQLTGEQKQLLIEADAEINN
jgi:hypothetical protein